MIILLEDSPIGREEELYIFFFLSCLFDTSKEDKYLTDIRSLYSKYFKSLRYYLKYTTRYKVLIFYI